MERFFKEEHVKAFNAFVELPIKPDLHEVIELKAYTEALKNLKRDLLIHVEDRGDILLKGQRDEEADKVEGEMI